MRDPDALRRRALVLMREAMPLLDEAGEHLAMARLQAVLDTVDRVAPLRPGDKLPENTTDAEPVSKPSVDPALVRAIGGALSVMATVMARQGDTSLEEMARLLGIYAVLSGESSKDEGMLIGAWGAMLLDVAEEQRKWT